ncbi:MAG: ATP-dependent DNA helicase RecG [Bacteroidales bacterium]
MNLLQTPIVYLKGVGPARADLLNRELKIATFGDLLWFIPFRYIDRTVIHTVRSLTPEHSYVQLVGRVVSLEKAGSGSSTRLVARFRDATGEIELVWFQGHKWVKDSLKTNVDYLVFGKLNYFNGRYSLPHPEIEVYNPSELAGLTSALQPVYSSTEKLKSRGLASKGMAKLTRALLDTMGHQVPETLDHWILERLHLMSLPEALRQIHFPQNAEMLEKARTRLKFEELFFAQLEILHYKHQRKKFSKGHAFKVAGEYFNEFYNHHLPFPLTNAQKRVIREIFNDLKGPHQMNRLLQGDVGSGKTLVALMSMLIALGNGYQACMMAPTEILAQQHYATFTRLLGNMAVDIRLLTGSTRPAERQEILPALQQGKVHIIIGTHALIEDAVQFANLGLVVIDEQHRFGVEQRARLWQKNDIPPHVLVMTATPIPRTLAMTLYGDLDYSVIDEMPPGRKPVVTKVLTDRDRLVIFHFMREQIKQGRQVYVVYPLIDESEKLDLKHVMDGYESITREFPLPEYAVSIVHGRQRPQDKEYEMERFKKGETQIMVSTTVIEVGVDVPNATVMVIENAERFGLSQLHQLRGRVGRGAEKSYCLLVASEKLSKDAMTRLRTMEETHDGFKIADVDLQLRGPGDLNGTRQSGMEQLRIASIVEDNDLLLKAKDLADRILNADPRLEHSANQRIAATLAARRKDQPLLGMIS